MSVKKIGLIVAGCICTALGVLGALLPVLPATPFLLAASFCFMKSSGRLYAWLMGNRFLGPRLERLKSGRGLTAREKIIIYCTAFACIVPVIILTRSLHLRIFLIVLLAVKGIVFLKMKTAGTGDEPPCGGVQGNSPEPIKK